MNEIELDDYIKRKVAGLTEKYFERSSDGNNRQWAKRYSSMMSQWKLINATNHFNDDFKAGYKLCLSHFHEISGAGLDIK
jgi:hypothetical protein